MSEIDDRIATYLQAIQIEGKTPKTIASYVNSLQGFRRVEHCLGFPEQANDYEVPHVYAFLGALRERGASAGYQHRRHREVETCFSWLERMEFVGDNVFAKVPLVMKRPYLVKAPFTPAEVRALLGSQDRDHCSGCRNYASFSSSTPVFVHRNASRSRCLTWIGSAGVPLSGTARVRSCAGLDSANGPRTQRAITSSDFEAEIIGLCS